MNDLTLLLPHSKKESKFDNKKRLQVLNELVELNNCTSCLYFEVRRHEDLYLWASLCPTGPSVKFHVQNVHSLEELNMTGNCLKGSRPVLSFDESFNAKPQFQLVKAVLAKIFNAPENHRKSKPFIDRVMTFSILDGRIWIRNYQVGQ